jgi:TonB family protein
MVLAMLVAAFLLNLGAGFAAHQVIRSGWDGPLPSAQSVMEVALVPSDLAATEEEEAEEEQKEEELLDGELVQNHRLIQERRPQDTDKISEFDNTVPQETKAPNVSEREGGAPQKQGDRPDAQQGDQGQKPAEPSERPPSPQERDAAAQEGEGEDAQDSELVRDEQGRQAARSGAGGAPALPGIRGSHSALRDTFGSRGSIDRLEDVDDGAENLLNTRRHRFASFFNRVRNAVAQHWHPDVVHAARDPYGKIYGTKTRVTRLMIRLNPDGSLKRVVIDKKSGIGYLDEEAIRAVRTAQPFTNPPEQLVDTKSGFIDFGFVFIFEIGGKTRIHRYHR